MVNFSLKMYEVDDDKVKFEDLNISIDKDMAWNYLTEMYDTKNKLKTKHYGEALKLLGVNDDILETILHENSKINFDFLDKFNYEEEKLESSAIHIATLDFREE